MNNSIIAISVWGMVKVVLDLVCDKGLPKTNGCPKNIDISKCDTPFPKPDLGKLKFPDLPIFKLGK